MSFRGSDLGAGCDRTQRRGRAFSGIVVPGTDTTINSFKVGDFGVQIAIAMAFLWLDGPRANGEPTPKPSRTTALARRVSGACLRLTQNRGGFLASATTFS